jgi:hypothetical protein
MSRHFAIPFHQRNYKCLTYSHSCNSFVSSRHNPILKSIDFSAVYWNQSSKYERLFLAACYVLQSETSSSNCHHATCYTHRPVQATATILRATLRDQFKQLPQCYVLQSETSSSNCHHATCYNPRPVQATATMLRATLIDQFKQLPPCYVLHS